MSNPEEIIADFGLQDIQRRFRESKAASLKQKTERLADLIHSIDASSRQHVNHPVLPPSPPPCPVVSNLVCRTHNLQKTADVMGIIAANLRDGVHLLALQEVNMPVSDINLRLLSFAPGAIAQGATNGHTNGVVTIIHPDIAPYVRPLQLDGKADPGNVSQCLDALTLALPTLPPFNFFNIYSSGQQSLRGALARALQPWVSTPSVFLGDFNHAQSNVLDSINQSSPSKWLWLREKLTPTDRRPSELLDLFRLHHPNLKQMTRLVFDPATGRGKGSRIDYVLLGTPLRDWVSSTGINILQDTLGSDNNPVQFTKQVPPFAPPPVIINDVLRLNELKPDQVDAFHSLLEPMGDTISLFSSLMDHLSPQTVFHQSEIVFRAIELAAREVTGCTPHLRKPSSAEKKLSLLLTSDRGAPDFAKKCGDQVQELHEARTLRANRRVHASLVSGRGMKKAIAAHSKISTPPIALIGENNRVSQSPEESCSIMSKTLSKLGG